VLVDVNTIRTKPIFWEWSVGRAVRKGDWKLVTHGKDAPWELYNLKSDPSETQNLIKQNPEIARDLELEFQNWKKRVSL
jgi:arylsulfatase